MSASSIDTSGPAMVHHRDGAHYRAEAVEIRDGLVLALAHRSRPGKGRGTDPVRRYAWPSSHVTVRWEEER